MRPVGDCEEPRGTGKEIEQEVGRQSKSVHVDPQVVDDARQSVNLFHARELRFVNDEDVDTVALESSDVRREITPRLDSFGAGFDADTTCLLYTSTMPVTAAGRTIFMETLWGFAPSARPASRSVWGTPRTAISEEITMTGSIKTAKAKEPAMAEKPILRSCTIKLKANSPMRIEGAPAIVWAVTRSDAASFESDSAR